MIFLHSVQATYFHRSNTTEYKLICSLLLNDSYYLSSINSIQFDNFITDFRLLPTKKVREVAANYSRVTTYYFPL